MNLKIKSKKLALFFASFFIFSFQASATLQTARQLSYAGSAALNPYGIDALNLNPAVLNVRAGLTFGAGYQFGDAATDQSTKAHYAWLKDSSSSAFKTKRNRKIQKSMEDVSGFPVAAAFVYNNLAVEDSQLGRILDYKSYSLGLSTLVTKRVSAGLNFSYFDGAQGLGFSENFANVDFGLLYWATPKLKVGLSALDLISTASATLFKNFEPQRVRLSAAYATEWVDVYADVEHIFSGPHKDDINLGVGFESPIKEYLAIRVGLFKRQSIDALDFGIGLSFTGPKLQLHYGFRRNSSTGAFINSIDLSMPIW